MKKLVFQINVPNYSKNNPHQQEYLYNSDMYVVSNKNATEYADKHKADYYLLTDPFDYKPAASKHLDYQKLKIYDFLEYDAILYLDSDYIIKKNAPDVFDLFQDNFSAVRNPGKKLTTALASELGIPRLSYFNAGFMYIPKKILDLTHTLVHDYLDKEYTFQGQGLLCKMFYEAGVELNPLSEQEWNPVKETWGLYGDHYCGRKKKRWGQVSY